MNPDAKERFDALRAKVKATTPAPKLPDEDSEETSLSEVDKPGSVGTTEEPGPWDHIPAQQILVVEQGGRVFGAVTVDTPDGRTLYSREPCPTCGQDWTHSPDGSDVKILWPDSYKTDTPAHSN